MNSREEKRFFFTEPFAFAFAFSFSSSAFWVVAENLCCFCSLLLLRHRPRAPQLPLHCSLSLSFFCLCQQLYTAAAITLLLPVDPESKCPVVVVLGCLVSRHCLLLLRLDQIVFLFSLRLLFFIRFESSSDSSDWKLFVCLERERGVESISPGKTSSIR